MKPLGWNEDINPYHHHIYPYLTNEKPPKSKISKNLLVYGVTMEKNYLQILGWSQLATKPAVRCQLLSGKNYIAPVIRHLKRANINNGPTKAS
jgi:hypothetical protein